MKSVLVTGATSFLGVQTVARLMSGGFSVQLLVRPGSDLSRLPQAHAAEHIHVYDGTLESISRALTTTATDVCFHMAGAYVRDHAPEDLDRLIDSNIRFGSQLLEALAQNGPACIVNAGTAFQHYQSNDYAPLNLYAATKQAFADILAYYEAACGIVSTTLKLPDVYGAYDWRPKLMNRIVEAHLKSEPLDLVDKATILGLVYVDDASDAFIHCARKLLEEPAAVAGKSFAVDTGRQYPLHEIVAIVERVSGKSTRTNWGAYATPARHISTPWKGTPLPDWDAEIDLEEGVRRLVAAVAEQPCP